MDMVSQEHKVTKSACYIKTTQDLIKYMCAYMCKYKTVRTLQEKTCNNKGILSNKDIKPPDLQLNRLLLLWMHGIAEAQEVMCFSFSDLIYQIMPGGFKSSVSDSYWTDKSVGELQTVWKSE